MNNTILAISGVSKSFGGVAAVSDVSMCVRSGEIVGLIGANGAGKSTLLRMAAGLLAPDSGSIRIAGKEVDAGRPHLIFKSPGNSSYLRQVSSVVSPLTLEENVTIGFRPGIGRSVSTIFSRRSLQLLVNEIQTARGWLAEVLPDSLGLGVDELSTGQKRRLELIRLKAGAPILALLDEPTAGLHSSAMAELEAELVKFNREGLTILLSEHNLEFVTRICNRCLIMDRGQILKEVVRGWGGLQLPSPVTQGRGSNHVTVHRLEREAAPALVTARDLRGGYHSRAVFGPLCLSVSVGDVVGFVGPNGSGKSTALRAIAGLLPWRSGDLIFSRGFKTALGTPRGISMLSQERAIFPNLTVYENLLVAADQLETRGRREQEIARVRESLSLPGTWLRKRGECLSVGEQRIVAIAMRLITNPGLLLLDEPTAGLAQGAIDSLIAALSGLSECAIVAAEHNLIFLSAMGAELIHFEPLTT